MDATLKLERLADAHTLQAEEISKLIKKMKGIKAPGVDSIPVKVFEGSNAAADALKTCLFASGKQKGSF